MLCLLIVLASVTLLAPSYAIAALGPFKNVLEDYFDGVSMARQVISNYFAPLVIILINFVVIPSLIEVQNYFGDYQTESTMINNNITMFFLFTCLSTLIVPIT